MLIFLCGIQAKLKFPCGIKKGIAPVSLKTNKIIWHHHKQGQIIVIEGAWNCQKYIVKELLQTF